MKLLYTSLYDSRFSMGGAEKVLLDLALCTRRDFGAEVACAVNSGDLERELHVAGIPVYRIPVEKWRAPEIFWRYQEIFSSFRPDVVHSHHRFTTFILDLAFKKRSKILHTEHVLRQDKARWFRYGHRASAVHESVRANLIRHFGVPPEAVVTIPNAVKCPAPVMDNVTDLKEAHAGTVHALCIGRFETQKGHHYLVEAVSRLPENFRTRLKIFLAGDGPLLHEIEDLAEQLGVRGQFVFLGYVRSMADYLAFCDFLILPSLWEGMPLVLLEAAASGRAVIATDIPGSRESIRAGQTGVLVPPADPEALAGALRDFMEHPEKVRDMGQAGLRLSEQEFSHAVMMKNYWDLYANL